METKRCKSCGAQIYADEISCPYCGMSDFEAEARANEPPVTIDFGEKAQPNPEPVKNENVINGIVGAFLFSLGGVVLYFILYQLNYIAGVVGLVTFSLANLGYGIFSGTKGKGSVKGVIISAVVMLIMIAVAEFLCLGYLVHKELGEELGLSLFESIRVTPKVLTAADMWGEVAGELGIAYLLGAVGAVASIASAAKQSKNAQKQ